LDINYELIWEGEPTDVRICSGGHEGVLYRHSHKETKKNEDETYTVTEVFEEYLHGFQGDTTVWGEDDCLISQTESSCEFYDYVLWVPDVIKIEKDKHGDIHLTIKFRRVLS